MIGWGVGQWPWILTDELKVEAAAASDPTLWGLVVVFAVAAVTVLPALVYLFVLTQREDGTPEG